MLILNEIRKCEKMVDDIIFSIFNIWPKTSTHDDTIKLKFVAIAKIREIQKKHS